MNTKSLFFAGICCLLFTQLPLAAELVPYQGNPVAFDLPDPAGKRHSLDQYRGRIVLVNFWASWCPPCIQEMPSLARIKERFSGQPFEVLAVNVGEPRFKVRKFVKLINFRLPVLLDTQKQVFDDWQVGILPSSFLIDAQGNVRYHVQGDPGWNSDGVTGLIEELLSEQEKTP